MTLERADLPAVGLRSATDRRTMKNRFPPDWNEKRIRDVLRHFSNQSDEAAIAKDEARLKKKQNLPLHKPKGRTRRKRT